MSVLESFTDLSNKILVNGEVRESATANNSSVMDPATEVKHGELLALGIKL